MRRHPVLAVLGGLILLLVVVAVLFDWNWVRPPIERYISQKTQREFRMSDLHVRLGFTPTIRMRDVYFGNADWSKENQPMAKAEQVEFSVSLRDLPEKLLIPRVALTRPERVRKPIDERQPSMTQAHAIRHRVASRRVMIDGHARQARVHGIDQHGGHALRRDSFDECLRRRRP